MYLLHYFNDFMSILMLFLFTEDPLRLETETSKTCRLLKFVPRLLQMLRECLLTHRWEEALSVLQGITMEPPKNTAYVLWKVAY